MSQESVGESLNTAFLGSIGIVVIACIVGIVATLLAWFLEALGEIALRNPVVAAGSAVSLFAALYAIVFAVVYCSGNSCDDGGDGDIDG